MANDYFIWNGVDSREMGVRAIELPPITIGEERVKYESVAGRSGSVTMTEGAEVYEDITLGITCLLNDISLLDAALRWLKGTGRLSIPNRPGGWYEARVSGQIELSRVIAARADRQFPLTFRARPCFYLDGAETIELTGAAEAQQRIENPGNLASAPRITVTGSGGVGIELAGQLMEIAGMDGGIILDTHLQDALSLDGAQLLNGMVTGDFLTIPPGVSMLQWFPADEDPGTVTKIEIEPRWRSL